MSLEKRHPNFLHRIVYFICQPVCQKKPDGVELPEMLKTQVVVFKQSPSCF